MEYCRNCGNSVIAGSKFCNACGEAIPNETTTLGSSKIEAGNMSTATFTKSDDNKKFIRFLKSKWVISIVVLLILGFGSL